MTIFENYSKLSTENSILEGMNSKLRTENSTLKAENKDLSLKFVELSLKAAALEGRANAQASFIESLLDLIKTTANNSAVVGDSVTTNGDGPANFCGNIAIENFRFYSPSTGHAGTASSSSVNGDDEDVQSHHQLQLALLR